MKTLLKKLAAAQAELSSIEKTGYNDFQKYKYVKEADVLDAVRPLLIKHGIFPHVSTKAITNIGDMTQVEIIFSFICVDTQESLSSTFFGQGCDKQDKAAPKAYTSAIKYCLMKQFLISSDDDPENEKKEDSSDNRSAQAHDNTTLCVSGRNKGKQVRYITTEDLENDINYWSNKDISSGPLLNYLKAAKLELTKRNSNGFRNTEENPPLEDLPF